MVERRETYYMVEEEGRSRRYCVVTARQHFRVPSVQSRTEAEGN
jgi:hypothetical protein